MARRIRCFVCNLLGNARQMPRIGDDEVRQEIAISRRDAINLPNIDIQNDTRICFNCNQSLTNELEAIRNDPTCLRLNIVKQKHNRTCIFCEVVDNTSLRISMENRVHIFIQGNIFVPDGARCCVHHLNHDGRIILDLIPGLTFVNRPYVIPGPQLQVFLEQLRKDANHQRRLEDLENLDDEEFSCLFSLNKEQFQDLLIFCDPVPDPYNRNISKKDLMTFLCKLRQGLSDEFLRVIFNYPSRQATSMAISNVRKSLEGRFVFENIGVEAISRDEFINRHVTPFANELFNNEPNIPKGIVICDATYAYIHKSSNFRVLRQSYSLHKGRHLLKPTIILAPDGYILSILGPYFSDSYNNDASILVNEFERDAQNLGNWFRNGDIFLIDRGYRDCTPFLTRLGIVYKMPALLERGQRQLPTLKANDTRIVTKVRWIVESRNGHFKTIFKMLDHTFNVQNAKHIGSYYRICGAIINRYHPPINMQSATIELARNMLQRRNDVNVVQARVEVDNLQYRNAQWRRLHDQVPRFPQLDIDYLRDLTIGVYQVNLAPSYIQDKLQRDDDDELQIDTSFVDNNFIRLRVYSRFRNRTKHQVFISYIPENELELEEEVINGYYCTCQSGARTLGTCAHVASVLWFLGFACHQRHVKYPDGSLLNTTRDAANRGHQEDMNVEILMGE